MPERTLSLTRRDLMRQFALASPLALIPPLSAARPRPLNFLFILIDDMGWTDLGCTGSKYYETPNIDRFRGQSMRFTNAYAACPVCSPTRASILTGRYPARLQLTDWIPGRKQWPTAKLLTPKFEQQLPLAEITLAEALKPLGYASAAIGKWHLGGEGFSPEQQGFDLNVAGNYRGSPVSYFGPFHLPNLDTTDHEYLTDVLTAKAESFIEENRSRPFFLYLAHFAVHLPLQGKPKLVEKYTTKPADPNGHHNPVYAAMIDSVDQGVGRILGKLDELGIADHTVVFFFSDNGGLRYEGKAKDFVTSNAPLRAGKGFLYEGGIREPMMVRWPSVVKPGSTCDVPVISVDFFPTILEMAGIKHSPQPVLDGVSISRLLKGGRPLHRDALYWHYPHYSNQGGTPGGGIRHGDYKLIEFYEDGHLELYNLAHDAGERNNLASKVPAKKQELHRMLRSWRASVNAAMPEPNPNYDPATADQGLTGEKEGPGPLTAKTRAAASLSKETAARLRGAAVT